MLNMYYGILIVINIKIGAQPAKCGISANSRNIAALKKLINLEKYPKIIAFIFE